VDYLPTIKEGQRIKMETRGKPPFKPTAEQRKVVYQMSSVGTPQEQIAQIINSGIDVKTLRKYFRQELNTASTIANAAVGGVLYDKAMSGDTTAMIWWTKARNRWSEKTETELSGDLDHHVTIQFEPSGKDV
jgi:hypothetical protein|tara:strand:- start:517 stop:912 length:396 start_codon:yes stop_codon:yes gene_type:complete